MTTLNCFKKLFQYDSQKTGFIGIERECFIADKNGTVVPRASEVILRTQRDGWLIYDNFVDGSVYGDPGSSIGYELSNCQIETRTSPCPDLKSAQSELEYNEFNLNTTLARMGLRSMHSEVGPADMPLDVYPDPTGRYQKITQNMPHDVLLAACRVIGTHVHIGMRDHVMALRVYNYAAGRLEELCELGNGSFGERLAIYRQMAPDYEPKPYSSWEHYHQVAMDKGFAKDPRKCWTLIRISVHGTIEFRVFGATDSIDRIVGWASKCLQICQEAM